MTDAGTSGTRTELLTRDSAGVTAADVGPGLNRIDGPLKVAGEAPYTNDFRFDELAHGAFVQSTIAAGQISAIDTRAAERALPLLRAGKSLRFLALPAGEDPDSLIRSRGAEAITRNLDLARPLVDLVWSLDTEGKPADTQRERHFTRANAPYVMLQSTGGRRQGHSLTQRPPNPPNERRQRQTPPPLSLPTDTHARSH